MPAVRDRPLLKPLEARIYLLVEEADSVFGFPRLPLLDCRQIGLQPAESSRNEIRSSNTRMDREEVRLRPLGLAGGTDDSAAAAERGNKAVNHRFGDH